VQNDTNVALDELIGDPFWFPENFDPGQNRFTFVRTDRATLASQPFLDHRWNRAALARAYGPLDAVAARLPPLETPAKLHFIWHTSFCCSTLIAEALDRAGSNLSLREPVILVTLADAKRDALTGRRAMPPRLIELAFQLLARPEQEGAHIIIKPSNFANILLQDAARGTSGKSLFLYSDLEKFLLSIAKGGLQLRKYARRLFAGIVGDRGEKLPWAIGDIIQMSDLEIAAIAWHLQIAELQRSRPALGTDRVALLNCDRFLADPLQTLVKLDSFFELGLGEEYLNERISGAFLKRDAKRPGTMHDAKSTLAQYDAARATLGSELADIVAWSYRACPATPRDLSQLDPL
jgi:hypothetical protein